MMSSELLCCPIAERVVLTLAHFLWQGGLIAGFVLVGSVCVGPKVQRRYLVSLAGLLLLIACPLATFTVLSFSSEPADSVAVSAPATPVAAVYEPAPVELAGDPISTTPSTSNSDYLTILSPWLLALWMLGVVVCSCRLCLNIAYIAWLKQTGRAAGELVHQRAAALCERINMRVPVVRVSRRVAQAMAVGFWRPVIIIPTAWLIQLPPDCLEAVLAHELAHIRRRDLWVILLERWVETVLFYHPAVWWLSARLRSQREMCCDELAVSLTGRRVEYASTLELVARRRRAYASPALAAGLGGEKMALLNRVRNILGLSPAGSGVGPWTLGAVALLAAGTVGWFALGGNPMAAFAGETGDEAFVAFQDDEEGERERRREGDRDREEGERERERGDRDREEGEREGRRDGDRERGEREHDFRRDGDRERGEREGDRPRREGEFRRDGDGPRPPHPEEFRRRIEEMKRRVHALAEQGRREEAEALERQLRVAIEHFERAHREGDRPHREGHPDVPAEVREHLGRLHRQLAEAREAGREDLADRLERQIRGIHEELHSRHEHREREGGEHRELQAHLERLHRQLAEAREAGREGAVRELEQAIRNVHERIREHHGREHDRPRPDVRRPEGGPNPELMQVIRELRAEVMRLRNEVNELKGRRGEGDRPRFEGERPRFPREGDRPRFGDRPRGEGERDRPRFEGDRPRFEGERERPRFEREREGDERGEGERRREREQGERGEE